MSDIVRNYLLMVTQKDELIDALDAERAEHAQQISIAEVKISNLRSEHVREIAELDTWMLELEKEIADLKVALRAIESADTADWCRPSFGLQGMARDALLKTKDKTKDKKEE